MQTVTHLSSKVYSDFIDREFETNALTVNHYTEINKVVLPEP